MRVFVRDSVCVRLQVSACACVSGCARKDCVHFQCPTNPHVLALCSCVQVLSARVLHRCTCLYVAMRIVSMCAFLCEMGMRAPPFTEALEVQCIKLQGPESSDPKPTAHLPPPSPPAAAPPPYWNYAKAEEAIV